ncbi:MAG TPA: hypothetical protein EYG86_02745 [Crocinitomicaceae bacterium]|nr:hypothetical protein [Crocinitomicaceae bacterium]
MIEIILQYPFTNKSVADDSNGMSVLFWASLPFIFAAIYWLKAKKMNHDWSVGIFNNTLPYSRDNLLEAYIYLAAQLIAKDRNNVREKIQFISSHFGKYFKASDYDFRASLTSAYKNPYQLKAVSSWLNAKVRKKNQRIQIMYFLAGICMVDGRIIGSELQLLEKIAFSLKISSREFQSILAMYQKTGGHSKSSSYKNTHSNSSSRTLSKKSINCRILGVSENASFVEIKKAYRKMVKTHHPDRFHNESKAQQEIAKSKFIKIQKAYEYLEMVR